MHNNHIDVDFIYFDNLFNWTSSEMLEIMPNTVAIITTGIKIWFIKTVIMFVEINIIDYIYKIVFDNENPDILLNFINEKAS